MNRANHAAFFVYTSCRFVLGFVFTIAGLYKGGDLLSFHSSVVQLHLFGGQLLPAMIAIVLPGLELAVGISLLTGFALASGVACGLLLSAVFAGIALWGMAMGASPCGCLPLPESLADPLTRSARNLLILAGMGWVAYSEIKAGRARRETL